MYRLKEYQKIADHLQESDAETYVLTITRNNEGVK